MKVDVSFNIEDQTIRIVADGEGQNIFGIYIDTQEDFICNNEYSQLATRFENIGESQVDMTIKLDGTLNGRLGINSDIRNDLYFIFVRTCSDELYYYIAYDEKYLYNMIFNCLHDSIAKQGCCKSTCTTSDLNIVNILIALKAFEMADSGKKSVYYWNLLHNNACHNLIRGNSCSDIINSSRCSCHG